MVLLDCISEQWNSKHELRQSISEECGGSVVECLTLDRGVAGSILTRGAALCP